jgi:hypothetical protein
VSPALKGFPRYAKLVEPTVLNVVTAGIAQVPSPLQNVEADAFVPLFKLVTGRLPVTPVDKGSPVAFVSVAEAGVPKVGVTNVGLVDNTLLPEPVEVVTPVPPLATGSVPVTPVLRGKPVAFVSVAEAGVPNAGVTSVGLVANTKAPEPVSPVTAAAKLADEGVPKNVATPAPKDVRPVPPEVAASGESSVKLGRWLF